MKPLLIVVTLILLAGCGQKGPLFMPSPSDHGTATHHQTKQETDNG